jgi:hypothetical protein
MILKPKLNGKNKITAAGLLAVQVLKYGFGITECRFEETQKKSTKKLEMCKKCIEWVTRKVT